MNRYLSGLIVLLALMLPTLARAEDGYDLWLRYRRVEAPALSRGGHDARSGGHLAHDHCCARGTGTRAGRHARKESARLAKRIARRRDPVRHAGGVADDRGPSSSARSRRRRGLSHSQRARRRPQDHCRSPRTATSACFTARSHFLRLIQTRQPLDNLDIASAPRLKHRVLDHWDNLEPHHRARLCRLLHLGLAEAARLSRSALYATMRAPTPRSASTAWSLNNVVGAGRNADAALHREGRRAGERVPALWHQGLSLRALFSAPIELGGLKTADPLDPAVKAWWQAKADEIYRAIPDFGGFLVKANSEGQPGPQDYRRTHADGANMLADALAPHHGIVMWRAFVYSADPNGDRAKQAYDEFGRSTASSAPTCFCRSRTVRSISSRASRFIRCSARCRRRP